MSNFAEFNLDSNINKAISHCGYKDPTPVQSKSIPLVLRGKDVVVSAPTGTGKTASFVLPVLDNLTKQPPIKKTRVVILTPTRELAAQITTASSLYGKFMRFNIVSIVGGMPYPEQIKNLARGADIIVATPGRLMDHIEQKRVDLSHVNMLVLDEADRMLDMGFIEDVQYIAKLTPSHRQTLLFSATLDNKLMNAVKHLLKNPARVDLSGEKIAAPKIKQEMYKVSNLQHKTRLLKQLLIDQNIYKAIIFSATKKNAGILADELCGHGFAAAALHGDLRQNVRNRTLDQLRKGKIQFLVATDVAARGIDIGDITHVFNYDLPRFCEDYVHRIGRTGRAGKSGTAISFVSPADFKSLQSIERYIGQRVKLIHDNNTEITPEFPKRTENSNASRKLAAPAKACHPRESARHPSESWDPDFNKNKTNDKNFKKTYGKNKKKNFDSFEKFGKKDRKENKSSSFKPGKRNAKDNKAPFNENPFGKKRQEKRVEFKKSNRPAQRQDTTVRVEFKERKRSRRQQTGRPVS